MTNEQAISVLKSLICYYNDSNEDDCYVGFDSEDNEALTMAIKALEQPSFEEWLSSFNTESATCCFTAVQELKKKIKEGER